MILVSVKRDSLLTHLKFTPTDIVTHMKPNVSDSEVRFLVLPPLISASKKYEKCHSIALQFSSAAAVIVAFDGSHFHSVRNFANEPTSSAAQRFCKIAMDNQSDRVSLHTRSRIVSVNKCRRRRRPGRNSLTLT